MTAKPLHGTGPRRMITPPSSLKLFVAFTLIRDREPSARSVQQRSGPLPLRKRTDQRHLGWLAPTASPHQVPPGNSRQNRVLPCADVTLIDPPWVCIMARVIANPSPAPSVSGCDRDGSAR